MIDAFSTATRYFIIIMLVALSTATACYYHLYNGLKEKIAAAELKAEQEAHEQERQWQHKLVAAVEEAQKWESKYEEAVKHNNALTVRLRDATRQANNVLSSAPREACVKYAVTAGAVLSECGERLTDVAAKADGHVADVRKLTAAWPE